LKITTQINGIDKYTKYNEQISLFVFFSLTLCDQVNKQELKKKLSKQKYSKIFVHTNQCVQLNSKKKLLVKINKWSDGKRERERGSE
jgi:hypothetical protein